MSNLSGTWREVMFDNNLDFTAVASSAAEASLLVSTPQIQPFIPAMFFDPAKGAGKAIRLYAAGVIGSNATPTIIFQVRLGTTSGPTYYSGTSVGVSAAITLASGVTNKWWELDLLLQCKTPGIGTGAATLFGSGRVISPTGFGSPFTFPLEITTPDTATWTATIDGSLTQYVNLSVTWSASHASNTITCKQLLLEGLN